MNVKNRTDAWEYKINKIGQVQMEKYKNGDRREIKLNKRERKKQMKKMRIKMMYIAKQKVK